MSIRRAEDASSEGSSHQEGSESSHSSHLDLKKNHSLKTDQHDNFSQETGHPIQSQRSTTLSAEAEDENEQTTSHATTHLGGLIRFRAQDDDDPTDWWFASTAIPLLAATFAPMANMLSIAALVVYWRNDVTDDTPSVKYATSVGVRDPQWTLNLNGASLACGFVGNIFLLCNFTRKIRYIIALPVTIVLFYVASAILIGITLGMEVYDPPKDNQVYSQGFWHAVIAACLYMLNAMLLMVNMLGYFLGHYPQHFDLNDEQRNLILQTMIFFVWLAGGAAVFAKLDDFGYNDALYFCDVTLLTIGFGDFVATTDVARGFVFPYTVGGTIILGLMVSSIHKFAQELSREKVVKKHIETRRINTLSRAVSLQDLVLPQHPQSASSPLGVSISRPLEAEQIQRDLDEKAKLSKVLDRTISFHTPFREDFAHTTDAEPEPEPVQLRFQPDQRTRSILRTRTLERVTSLRHRIPVLVPSRKQKTILMRDEKDRFDKMRDIQHAARRFKKWYALVMSLISFGLLWCVGAVVFWQVEAETQGLTYFQALYFCYVSLLTIGYGDLSPKSNAGKPFFILWSLIAVPTMTILISDLGDTAIGGFKRKVLEYGGLAFLGKGRGWGLDWFTKRKEGFQRRLSRAGVYDENMSKVERALASINAKTPAQIHGDAGDVADEIERRRPPKTIDELADEALTEPQMVQDLAYTLQRVADDMKHNPDKRYSYEEWVEFTRLIRFSRLDRRIQDSQDTGEQLEADEALDGLIEWDWLDENSPMTSEQSEAEWVMDRLLESLVRTFRKTTVLQGLVQLSREARPTPVDIRRSASISVDAARRNSTGPMRSRMGSVATILSDGSGGAGETTMDVEQPQWSKRGQARLQNKRTKHHHRAASGFHGHMSQHVKRNRIPPARVPKKKKKGPALPVS